MTSGSEVPSATGSTLLKALAWIWVGIAVVFAIGCLAERVYLGAILSLMAAIAAAPVPEMARKWADSPVRAVPRALVSAVLWSASAVTLGAMAEPSPEATSSPAPQSKEVVAQAKPTSSPTAEPAKANLGITVGRFTELFNQHASKMDKPWRLRDVKISDDGFKYMLTDTLGLVGSVGRDNMLEGLIFIGSGDGTPGSGLDVFAAMVIAYSAAIGSDNVKHGPVIMDLVEKFDGTNQSEKIVNNVQLSYVNSEATGSIFTVEPVK
jgi:hypothetical protein